MTPATSIQEIRNVPFFSRFTEDQIRKQVKTNAEGLRKMEDKAISTGKRVGGFTAAELNEMATRYENMLK